MLATDLDTRWLDGAADPLVETRRHDVAADEPPAGPFDLVHARLVLVHVTDRARALRNLVSALRPGGWLLLEDADPALQPLSAPDEHGPAERLANRLRTGFRTLLAQRGADLGYGRTLPRALREAGLLDVQADAYFPITSPACRTLEAATVRQLRRELVTQGLATEAEIEEHLTNVATGDLDLATAPWSRRGAGGRPASTPAAILHWCWSERELDTGQLFRRLERLTPRELEVLIEVATGRSNAEIAERMFLSESTIKTHVGRILPRLGLRDRVQAVVLAYETGPVRPQ